MATLYIEEHTYLPQYGSMGMPIWGIPLTVQKFTVSGTSAQSAALNTKTRFVRLVTDVALQWEEGTSPTADTNSRYLGVSANGEAFGVKAGNKIAAINQQ